MASNGIKLNSIQMLCNLNLVNMLHFNYTSEAYHTHFYMNHNDHTMAFKTWITLNSYVEFEFANSFANTTFKLNGFTYQNIYIKFQPSTMCLCIVLILHH